MTFAFNLTRGLSLGALAAALTLGSVSAQNGSNYDLIQNSPEVAFFGIGAGGTQTAADGLLTHIRGENLKGSHTVAFSGDFGYRNPKFREAMCVFNMPLAGPPLAIRFPALLFVELDGENGNAPWVFTNPACLGGFPIGASGAVPYGTGPGSTASFVLLGMPTGAPVAPSTLMVAPNNNIAPAFNSSATLIAAASASLGIASTGFCWAVQFTWTPSSLPSLDDVDSWEHYVRNSGDGNQYWMQSDDEESIWQSSSIVLDSGATALLAFPANIDYGLLMSTVEPATMASLCPAGANAGGAYYTQTAHVVQANGAAAANPNLGFDVGRGSQALSLSGTKGVANPNTGNGNQNPPVGKVPAVGFVTTDNGGDGNGSVRLGWLSVDFLGLAGGDPALDAGVVKPFFGVRVPVVSAGLTQGITGLCFGLFGTNTSGVVDWPDPDGFPPGTFGVVATGAASNQFPTGGLGVCATVGGLAVNITYGTSGRKDGPGALTFNPGIADLSGTREMFLWD